MKNYNSFKICFKEEKFQYFYWFFVTQIAPNVNLISTHKN